MLPSGRLVVTQLSKLLIKCKGQWEVLWLSRNVPSPNAFRFTDVSLSFRAGQRLPTSPRWDQVAHFFKGNSRSRNRSSLNNFTISLGNWDKFITDTCESGTFTHLRVSGSTLMTTTLNQLELRYSFIPILFLLLRNFSQGNFIHTVLSKGSSTDIIKCAWQLREIYCVWYEKTWQLPTGFLSRLPSVQLVVNVVNLFLEDPRLQLSGINNPYSISNSASLLWRRYSTEEMLSE